MAQKAVLEKGVSIRTALEIFSVSQTCYRYRPKSSSENDLIAQWLLRLTDNHRNWGFGLCFLYLRNVKRRLPRQGYNSKVEISDLKTLGLNTAGGSFPRDSCGRYSL